MSNINVTQNSLNRGIGFDDAVYQDETFTAAGAGTLLKGTLLARDSVSGNLVVFVKGGNTNENGIPKAVAVVDTTLTGAGDIKIRPLIAGTCVKNRLVIDADGDDSNIDKVVQDQLRDYDIIVRDNRDVSFQEQ